jgi:hypothetical protein
MLTPSFIPGTTEPFGYIGAQIFAAPEPTSEKPPPLTWRYGQMRRWHKDLAFVYSLTNNPPACWTSISKLRAQPT